MAANPKTDPKLQEQEPEEATPQVASTGFMPKLIVLGVVVAVILLEAIGFMLLMPKGGDAAINDKKIEEQLEGNQPVPTTPIIPIDDPEPPLKNILEIPLGERFTVENPMPGSQEGRSDKFEIDLCAIIDKKDEKEFNTTYEAIRHTVRAEINQILKLATTAQKNDPKQVYIRHQVQNKLNALLGKPLVKRVISPYNNYSPP